jgi:hypothetical protein
MHALALLALFFGFTGMMLLDGQVFTHAVIGIVCGMVAVVCGMVLGRRGRSSRWTGWALAALGLGLGIWCGIESPSAYRYQKKFNDRTREQREKMEKQKETPKQSAAANPDLLGMGC